MGNQGYGAMPRKRAREFLTVQFEVKALDKAEYHLKLQELTKYVEEQDYTSALKIVESVEWRRVKSLRTLNMVADVYEANRMYR